ncbi:hypothetical protein CTRI78_v005214 [Colletotrichum trifolii]|uniref:Secreted in xylem 1 protein n=1 Tax=Colletotrichum trifolii TaxID=5466 RepID=A0A4R8RF90_COLTR|nr:hypothetical protein CTRI78_v005214 [Colletotrichum trifolii]
MQLQTLLFTLLQAVSLAFAVPSVVEDISQLKGAADSNIKTIVKGAAGSTSKNIVPGTREKYLRQKAAKGKEQYQNWQCHVFGDSHHNKLRVMYIEFNRLFGAALLEAEPRECFVARCGRFHFSWCNMTVDPVREDAGARELVANNDPLNGTSCMFAPEGKGFDKYKLYLWGVSPDSDPPSYGGLSTVKECEQHGVMGRGLVSEEEWVGSLANDVGAQLS